MTFLPPWHATGEAAGACAYSPGPGPKRSAIHVRDVELPAEGWGELTVCKPTPEIGRQWADNGESRDRRRQNKERKVGDVRHVPLHPDLVDDLRAFIDEHSLRLATYVKCICGQKALYRQRIEETLAIADETETDTQAAGEDAVGDGAADLERE